MAHRETFSLRPDTRSSETINQRLSTRFIQHWAFLFAAISGSSTWKCVYSCAHSGTSTQAISSNTQPSSDTSNDNTLIIRKGRNRQRLMLRHRRCHRAGAILPRSKHSGQLPLPRAPVRSRQSHRISSSTICRRGGRHVAN